MVQSLGDPTVGFIETSHKMSSTFAASRLRLQTILSVIVPMNNNCAKYVISICQVGSKFQLLLRNRLNLISMTHYMFLANSSFLRPVNQIRFQRKFPLKLGLVKRLSFLQSSVLKG